MTAYYVRSGAAGAGTGADWANAYTTLAAAFAGKSDGDVFYVSEDHAETQASAMTLTPPGSTASPVSVICVDHAGSVPPVSADLRTTATISTTAGSSITFAGGAPVCHFVGIIFNAGTGAGSVSIILPNTATCAYKFTDCSLRIGATGAAGKILVGNGGLAGIFIELVDTTLSFAAVGQGISLAGGLIKWRNTASALLGTVPTTLFDWSSNGGVVLDVIGVDLSAAGSGKTIIGGTSCRSGKATFTDCKLDASVTKASSPAEAGSIEVDFIRCGSSGINYRQHSERYAGTLDDETTVILTGGASNGTTGISWKIVTSANVSPSFPFTSPPIAIWNDTTGSSVTATLQGIWGGGSVPNNDDIWIEAEYLGSSGSPLASFVNSGKADPLASNAALSAGAGTWGGSTTKFKMAVTFTPQQKGWVYLRIKAAAASSTFYVDPKIALS